MGFCRLLEQKSQNTHGVKSKASKQFVGRIGILYPDHFRPKFYGCCDKYKKPTSNNLPHVSWAHGLLYCKEKGLYGCEIWTINKSDENEISVFEIKVLGSIYGPTKVNGEWRIRYKLEVTDYIMISKSFNKWKLQQLGGCDTYLDQWTPSLQQITFTNPGDTTKVGRSSARWTDTVEEDLKRNGVDN